MWYKIVFVVLYSTCGIILAVVYVQESELMDEKHQRQEASETLSEQVTDKNRRIAALTQDVDDGKDEIKTLKRRHANNVKVSNSPSSNSATQNDQKCNSPI